MNSLLGRQVDNNYIVRMYSIRGLGNMADIEGNQVCVWLVSSTGDLWLQPEIGHLRVQVYIAKHTREAFWLMHYIATHQHPT